MGKKMKIVMHCEYTGPAKDSMGAERIIEALTKALVLNGHEVVMLVNSDSDVSRMPAPVVSSIPKNFDIIHAHGTSPKLLNSFGLPWINSVNGGGSDPKGSPWHNNPHYVCPSKFICNISNNSTYVHSCMDPFDFIYKDKKQNYFAWLGGTDWGECKGLFTTINLAKKLKFNLKIAGIGKNKQIIEQIKFLCDDKIKYIGAVNSKEKAEFLANAKALFLFTRLPDACPVTVGESLFSGTPVIGSTNGAMPELIINNFTGILCRSEFELGKAVLNIKKIKSKDCREYALNNFTHIQAAQKYLQIYRNMLLYGNVKGE
jgi:hypothetical protein